MTQAIENINNAINTRKLPWKRIAFAKKKNSEADCIFKTY